MNNGANPKYYISGFSTDLIEISQIWTTLTGSDKSLTEGGDLDRSRVELQHPFWEILSFLSPPHVWAHLDEFWWMLQSTGVGVSPISSSIDSCTHWDSYLAHLDIDHALMDSPSATMVYLLGICAPWAGSPFFCINKAQAASSNLVRAGLRSCCHCNSTIFFIVNQEGLEAILCSACVCVDSQRHAANVVTTISFQFLCCFCFLASSIGWIK